MIVYLNGDFLPIEEARISPLDRGFLFGDGIYEVIPFHSGGTVGFDLHLRRMRNGLSEIGIAEPEISDERWAEIARELVRRNEGDDQSLYVHVTRGDEGRRSHAFPKGVEPTVFAMTQPMPPPAPADRATATGIRCTTSQDLRWRRCHIKSTSLLGNVLHFQDAQSRVGGECILYNANDELTEASASNVAIVSGGVVATPPLDDQILPGITRHILLNALRKDGRIPVEERPVTMAEVRSADEVWLTNSVLHVIPVVEVDGEPVGDRKVGPVWERASEIYQAAMFDEP